jgi:cystathionine beta-lyase
MEPAEIHEFLCKKAKLGFNAGYWFGREGAGFSRMNIASPYSVVKEGMERLVGAFKQR